MSLGNSRVSVTANTASCALNNLLDLLFVAMLHWIVAGAAAATLAAQLGSAVYCIMKLRSIPQMRLLLQDFRNGVIATGGLFVQTFVNGYGKLFVAGMDAAEKFFELITFTGSAFEGAFAAYSAQNFGTGNMPRLKAGFCCSLLLSLAGAFLAAALLLGIAYNQMYRRHTREQLSLL